MRLHFDFHTQYNQFYIVDELSPQDTDGDFWDPESYNQRLAVGQGILGIGTECYGLVKGEIEILDSVNNDFDIEAFDHIVEGGIDVKSGHLKIVDCPTSTVQLALNVNPGLYRVRIYSSNLDSVEGGGEGEDHYRIEIWPSENTERKLLKYYKSA